MKKLKTQIVVIAAHNNIKYLLLLQTSKERSYMWQNVTGSVDKNEDFLDAAKRELFEETGINSTPISTSLEFCFTDRWNKKVSEKVFPIHKSIDRYQS